MGNSGSVVNALNYLGVTCEISSVPDKILRSSKIIIPGVGSFRQAMDNMRRMNLYDAICEAVLVKKIQILGICLGMQLFTQLGEEGGNTKGFGFIEGNISKFSEQINLRMPHVGFNSVKILNKDSLLFKGLETESDFYFVHSYRLGNSECPFIHATCEYGELFAAAVERDNIFGVQFHPEKSQSNGLKMLSNFSKL
jgi:glutamine amidotransferase